MYIVKVRYDDTHVKNVFSCKDFSILAREVTLLRDGREDKHVSLQQNDLVFIMNGHTGDTIERYQAPMDDEPAEEKKK